MDLTPELAKRFRLADLAQKAKAGKLTQRDTAVLAQIEAGVSPEQVGTGYVRTWNELAEKLLVSTRALKDWRADPRYHQHPRPRPDGRHDIAAWHTFMVRHDLKRAAQSIDSAAPENAGDATAEGTIKPPPVAGSQAQWNVAIAALDHRKKENAIAVREGTLIEAAELEVPLGAMLSTFQTKGAAFPSRVARHLVGLRDVGEIEDKLREELDADFGDLQFASYLAADAVAAAVAALPFDPESESLLISEEKDRPALLQLVNALATHALRLLGSRAVAQATLSVSATRVLEDAPPRESRSRPESPAPGLLPATASPKRPPRKGEAAKGGKKRMSKSPPQPALATPEVEAAVSAPPPRQPKRRR